MIDIGAWMVKNYIEIGGIIGAAIATYAAKRSGYVTFGKAEERRSCPDKILGIVQKTCGDHPVMMAELAHIKESQKELKEDVAIINTDIKELLKRNGYRG